MMRQFLPLIFAMSLGACAGELYATVPPPEPQQEVIGVAPYPGAVWIGGYYGWEGGRHVWRAGHYEHGRPGQVWEPHRWEARGNRWVARPGRWRRG